MHFRQKPIDMNILQRFSGPDEDQIFGNVSDLDNYDDEMSPTIQKATQYWNGLLETAGSIPRISDVELMDIYDIASNIMIDDLADDMDLCRNRFWGSELTTRFSFEGSKKLVASYQPRELADLILKRYPRIVQSGAPIWRKTTKLHDHFNACTALEMIHLPLFGRENSSIQHVLSVFDFSRPTHVR